MKEERRLRPSTIIWDLDGTVWEHLARQLEVTMILEALERNYSKQIENEFLDMLKQFNSYFFDKLVTRDKIGEFIEKTMPTLFFLGISGRQFLEAWIHTNTAVLNPEAEKLMKFFSASNKKNIALTDWILEQQLNTLKDFGLLKYLEEVHSCENKYLKCNPKTISNIVKKGRNEEYVIIGDSLTSDIAFGNKANIASVWYNPDGKPNTTSFKPTFEVSSLLEITEFIS